MKTAVSVLAMAVLLTACGKNDAPKAAGVIDQFEVVSTTDAYGGATPAGAAGPYTVIAGIVHGKLNPMHPDNAGIVDIANAPVDADGYVDYTTDVLILRPKTAANARRVLFYDVVNRGRAAGLGSYIGGGNPAGGEAPDDTYPSLLRQGYTIVWSGWQSDIPQTGAGDTKPIGTRFPVAKNKDGTSITGLAREEFVQDFGSDGATSPTIALTYPPASMTDKSEVVFTARQSWLNAAGQADYRAPSVPVTEWSYVTSESGQVGVQFSPPASVPGPGGTRVPADAGTIYDFVYRAKDPVVAGIGFAAVRDLITFLKTADADAKGKPNPLADMKKAVCAVGSDCPASPKTNFDVAIGEGISQSGRYMRDFLYLGFNKDSAGGKVFDGMMPVIPASRRTWVNERFSQAGRWSKQHEDHWMPGDQFPFTYAVITDPVSGTTDGLMKKCGESNTCPKIMQIDGSYEWWGGRASLVVTDGAGHDLTLPENVRYYLVAGTQHGGGAGIGSGVMTQPKDRICQFAGSPVALRTIPRALVPALENWIVNGTAPPASQYPTIASGNMVDPTPTAMGFPNLSAITVPDGADATPVAVSLNGVGLANQIYVTNYQGPTPAVDLGKSYKVLVPKVDANGNETSGILTPEVAVPLATYTGWNVRTAGHAVGEGCTSNGMALPFAVSKSAKAATDSRATLADLYSGRADYAAKVGAAADALVKAGLLSDLDATHLYKADAAKVSPALIAAP